MARILSYTKAIREAQDIEMARDPNVFICGEDVGAYGTAFGQTIGPAMKNTDPCGCLDTPLERNGNHRASAWAPRPWACARSSYMTFMDFMGVCMDEVLNQIIQAGVDGGADRPSCPWSFERRPARASTPPPSTRKALESFFTHMPGMKVVVSSKSRRHEGGFWRPPSGMTIRSW